MLTGHDLLQCTRGSNEAFFQCTSLLKALQWSNFGFKARSNFEIFIPSISNFAPRENPITEFGTKFNPGIPTRQKRGVGNQNSWNKSIFKKERATPPDSIRAKTRHCRPPLTAPGETARPGWRQDGGAVARDGLV